MVNYRFLLSLAAYEAHGFPAVDACRRLGFADAERIWVANNTTTRTFAVDEAFARTWFDEDVCDTAEIQVAWMVAGEVVMEGCRLELAGTLTVERAKDLYVRARFAALEDRRLEIDVLATDDDSE